MQSHGIGSTYLGVSGEVISKGVHESGWIGFGLNLNLTRLCRVAENGTHRQSKWRSDRIKLVVGCSRSGFDWNRSGRS